MDNLVVFLIFYFVLLIFMIATLWKVFEKAGEPGWVALIPIYNAYKMTTSVAGKEPLWFFLLFIPLVGIVIAIMQTFAIAEKFGKSGGFAVGMLFLPFIFYPILAFGDAVHESQLSRRRRRSRKDYDDYEDEDERPRSRKRKDEEYDEYEDERPKKKRRRDYEDDEDDDDDRPARRRRRRDDDDD